MNRLFKKLGMDNARRFVWTPVPELGIEMHSREWSAGRDGAAGTTPTPHVPVVLVAGLGVSSRYWVPLARRLADHYDVLALDLPGFGRSKALPGSQWQSGPSPREQADQLRAWLDARRIDRVVLCGHSVGCQIVADFAARFPHRVERLVLAAPTYEAGKRTIPQQIIRLAAGTPFEIPWLLLVLAVDYGTAGPVRVVRQAMRSMKDPIEADLPLVSAPTLVIHGSLDPIVPRRWAEKVTSLLRDGTLVEVARIGHALQFSAADSMAEVLRAFIDGHLLKKQTAATEITLAPTVEHRRLGPLAIPPQPISARMHGLIGAAFAGATVALITSRHVGPRTRRTLATAAAVNAATSVFTDFEFGVVKKLPMATHATLDFFVGQSLLIAAARSRGEPTFGRWATAIIGGCQVATALLTHAPTGPATLVPVAKQLPAAASRD